MYRTVVGILGAFAVALLVVGLTFSASADRRAELRFVNGTEPKTLDPGLLTGQPGGRIATAIFEGLTRRDARTLEPAPGVAESWDLSEDGKTYTFHLRADARWTDGEPVTAHDFVYSWKRLLDPAFGSEYAYIVHPVRMAEAFNTFGSHADALEKKIVPALGKIARGGGAAEWQRFLAEQHVHGTLKHAKDAWVHQVLGRRKGRVEAVDVDRFRIACRKHAAWLRSEESTAKKRFGVDAGIFAKDVRTVVVELEAPTPYFLEITSFYSTMPVPKWVVERPGDEKDWFLPHKIVSNGPFRLESWKVNDRARLVRSETYWGRDEVKAETIDALSLENVTTSLNLYLTGEVDWLPSAYPTDLVDELKQRSDFYSGPGMIVYYYRFNNDKKPFDDRRVRRAFSLAIDRKLIVEKVLGLGQLPATGFVPPGMPGYEPPDSPLGFRLDEARRLLADAGYPGGKGLPEVGILYNTSESHKKIAEVIADQLRRNLGAKVTAYNQEWQSYLSTVRAGDYDMARAGWIGDYNDPNTFLDMWVTNGGNNQTGFSSSVYDRLIASAANVATFVEDPGPLLAAMPEAKQVQALIDEASQQSGTARVETWKRIRMLLLREAERILVQDELPIMPIYFYVTSGLVQPHVRGFYSTLEFPDGSKRPNLQDIHPLRAMWAETGGAR